MVEKTSQTSSASNMPNVPAVSPTSDTPYIQPVIGKLGFDTEHPDIFGIGSSPDNGVSFHVWASFKGLVLDKDDMEAIWIHGVSDRVKSEVNSATAEIPAVKSAADEAVKKADSAIASSKVNSDAIIAQSEAISEAKAAMDSATAEIQQTASNAASDAAKIRADLAQVQNEVDTAKASNSASVEALKSDVSAAKQDLADVHDSLTKAQAAAEESQKAIDNSIAKINSDIEQDRKDIASAQQANADTAKQLDTYSKQAQDQGKTIKSIQDKQDGFTATLADVQGNVTQVSDKVDGLSASLKDAQDNVASIKAQADQLSATLTDHAKSIATLTASAKELGSTLEDANGRLSKVEQTAQTNSSTLSDVQGDLSQVKQDASTLTATLKDAQGNISTLQHKADSVSAQLASAQGDIASLQTDVTGIKATLVSHEGDIHTLQADSKSLHDSMQDVQGNISTLQKTSTDVTSELQDHAGRISKVEQTASTLTNEFSDQDGRLSKVEQTATGTQQTVANQQGQINSIQTDVSGIHETITGQGNQIANINMTLTGLNSKYESVSGDLGKLKDQVTTNSTQITQNKQAIALKADQSTVNNLSGEVSQNSAQLKVQADQISSKVSSTDFKTLNDKVNGMKIGGRNLVTGTEQDIVIDDTSNTGTQGWQFATINLTQQPKVGDQITVSAEGTLTGKDNLGTYDVILYNSTISNARSSSKRLPSGKRASATLQVNNLDGNGDTVLLIYAGNGSDTEGKKNTVHHLKVEFGNVATDWTPAPEDTIAAIQKNTTAIDQANQKISLKADQTEVDQIKNTASQNSSRLDVMAGQISSKVTATDVNNIVDSKGYATTSTVQSLITQKAGTINESITNLTSKVNSNNGGGVNLLKNSEGPFRPTGINTNNIADNYGIYDSSTVNMIQGQTYTVSGQTNGVWSGTHDPNTISNKCVLWLVNDQISIVISADTMPHTFTWNYPTGTRKLRVNAYHKGADNTIYAEKIKIERGTVATPWTPAPSDEATVTQVQQITASIDGLQSIVQNKADMSKVTQLSNAIDSKVSQDDYNTEISQLSKDINLRVSKGDLISQINLEAGRALFQSKKIFMDADTVVMGPNTKAFIPSAAITNVDADIINTGVLNGIEIRQVPTNGRSIDIKDGNIAIASNDPYEPRISFTNNGKNMKMFNAVGDLEVLNQEFALFNFTPEDTHSLNPIPFFKVINTGQSGSGGAQLNMDHAIFDGYEWWTSAAGVTFGRTWNGVDKSSDYADIYAKSFVPHSELSAKTRIKKLDRKEALDKIMQDDMYTYQFKEDVRDGVSKRYASFIIDNVHDVAQYAEPEEFLSANGKGRDDGTQLAYLIAAVQYQQEQIEELKKKLEEK